MEGYRFRLDTELIWAPDNKKNKTYPTGDLPITSGSHCRFTKGICMNFTLPIQLPILTKLPTAYRLLPSLYSPTLMERFQIFSNPR